METEICILAGGLSSRMGRDKAALRFGTKTFLSLIKETARSLGCPVRIQREDKVERCGPLGGIYTAMMETSADRVLFLACDMPFVSKRFLERLMCSAGSGALFTRVAGEAGFPMLLRREHLRVVRDCIVSKEYSVQGLRRRLCAKLYKASAGEAAELRNINTPGELEVARQQWRKLDITSGRNMIRVRNLSIWRDRTQILQDICWEVKKGEHWAILGANGSGKTSLLSALTGYLSPSGGDIDLLDKRFGRTDWRELRKRVGLVSSSIRQLMADAEPGLETVVSGKYAMIDVWGQVTKSDRRKARAILKDIECSHLADRAWLYLSQGERQRILIGRALMSDPKILILDEPCAGLDPVARENFLQFIERLGRSASAPTLALVTHHVEEITPVFSHVLLLKEGKLVAAGAKPAMLTSKLLSQTFGSDLRIHKRGHRYSLIVRPNAGVVI